MDRILKLSFVAALLLTATGCPGTAKPQLFSPFGYSTKAQRVEAQRYDPYPETNIGPTVEGGRPDGYTAPPPESQRGRPNQWNAPAYGS